MKKTTLVFFATVCCLFSQNILAGKVNKSGKGFYSVLLDGSEYTPANTSFYNIRRRERIFQQFNSQPGGMDAGSKGDMANFLIERKFSYLNPPGWMKFYFKIKDDTSNVPVIVEMNYQKGKAWHRISPPVEMFWDEEKFAHFGDKTIKAHRKRHKREYYNRHAAKPPQRAYIQYAVSSSKSKAKDGIHVLTIKDAFKFVDAPFGINYAISKMLAPYIIIDAVRVNSDRKIELVKIEERYDLLGAQVAQKSPELPLNKKVDIQLGWWRPDYKSDTSFVNDKAVTSGHILDKLWCMPSFHHPLGGCSKMIIKNNGAKTLIVKDILIDNVSVAKMLDRGTIYWYRAVPEVLRPGKETEITVSFRQVPKSHKLTVAFDNKTEASQNIQVNSSKYKIALLGTDKPIKNAFIYIEGPKEFVVKKLLLNNTDYTTKAACRTINTLDGNSFTFIRVPLVKKMQRGDFLSAIVMSDKGKTVAGRVKVWNSEFMIGAWTGVNYDAQESNKRSGIPDQSLNSIWACAGGWKIMPSDVKAINSHKYSYIIPGHNALGYMAKIALKTRKHKNVDKTIEKMVQELQKGRSPFGLEHTDEINNHDVLTYGYPGYYAQLMAVNQDIWEKVFPHSISTLIVGNTLPVATMRVYGQLPDMFNFDYYVHLDPREDIINIRSACKTIRAATMPAAGVIMLGSLRYQYRNLLKKQPQKVMDGIRFAILLSAASGVRGVTYFALSESPMYGTLPYWREVAEVNRSLANLSKSLNKSQPAKLAQVSDKNSFAETLICGDDGIALFVFNGNYKKTDLNSLQMNENDQITWTYPKNKETSIKVQLPNWFVLQSANLVKGDKKIRVPYSMNGKTLTLKLNSPKIAEVIFISNKNNIEKSK